MISRSPKSCVTSFIKGFVDAKGSVGKGRIEITQENRKILEFLQLLLLRFGIVSKVSGYDGVYGVYSLSIHGTNIPRFLEQIGLTAHDKRRKLEKRSKLYDHRKDIIPIRREKVWVLVKELGIPPSRVMQPRKQKGDEYKYLTKRELESILEKLSELNLKVKTESLRNKLNFLRKLVDSHIGWQKIRKIRVLDNDEPLFDLTIPGKENFIANGCLVHNSTYRIYLRKSSGEKRIARMMDSPNLPPGECVFKITPEGIRDVK